MAISDNPQCKRNKCCRKGKGRKGAYVAIVSARVDTKPYMNVKLPFSKKAYIKAIMVSLEAANAILP